MSLSAPPLPVSGRKDNFFPTPFSGALSHFFFVLKYYLISYCLLQYYILQYFDYYYFLSCYLSLNHMITSLLPCTKPSLTPLFVICLVSITFAGNTTSFWEHLGKVTTSRLFLVEHILSHQGRRGYITRTNVSWFPGDTNLFRSCNCRCERARGIALTSTAG